MANQQQTAVYVTPPAPEWVAGRALVVVDTLRATTTMTTLIGCGAARVYACPSIEAGRALHVDYAAPGAEVHAMNARGRPVILRGTSFATPLVAIRLADALARRGDWQARLDREARDLGPRGEDRRFGRGLLCEQCARKP